MNTAAASAAFAASATEKTTSREQPVEVELLLTSAEAVAYAKRARGAKFCVHIRSDAPVVDAAGGATDSFFRNGCSGYMTLTKKQAVKLLGEFLSESFERRGGRIAMTDRTYVSAYQGAKPARTIWIG
jgi:hypothetical protein